MTLGSKYQMAIGACVVEAPVTGFSCKISVVTNLLKSVNIYLSKQ